MSEKEIEDLRNKVKELELELQDRELDLTRYKNELVKANSVLEKLIKRVAKELDLVSQMQKWLVPTVFPRISGFEFSSKYLPGTQTGGDYIDIFETSDKFQFGIVASSSNGYAASANFLSALFKFSSDRQFRLLEPNIMLEMMVEEMKNNLVDGQETHLFYGQIDRRRYELHFSLLGKIQGLIWRCREDVLEKLGQSQKEFSSSFNESILKQTVSLSEKDILILCSTGITHIRNEQGECFGSQRLYQSILQSGSKDCHSLRNEILYQVEKFVGAEEFPCDMTVVVTEVQSQGLKLA